MKVENNTPKATRFIPHPRDIPASFALLTRLPVPVNHAWVGIRGAAAAWTFPLVGAVVGGLGGGIGAFALWLGVPAGLAAALALAVMILVTGGLHEDGLADTADGLWGGHTLERRLNIMKDSRIGAYGMLALSLMLIARWSGISTLDGWTLALGLGAIGAVSRAAMSLMNVLLPPARTDGLSATYGTPPMAAAVLGGLIALGLSVACLGWTGLWLTLAAYLAMLPVLVLASLKLNGRTGDTLGAAQQCAELGALIILTAAIT